MGFVFQSIDTAMDNLTSISIETIHNSNEQIIDLPHAGTLLLTRRILKSLYYLNDGSLYPFSMNNIRKLKDGHYAVDIIED